jgi:hypothetical protein
MLLAASALALSLVASAAASAPSLQAGPAKPAGPVGEELDRVVAVIRSPAAPEPRVITLSRLDEETRIALVSRGGLLAATERLDDGARAAGLEWLVDETLLSDEAARLRVFESDEEGGGDELADFRARFPRLADYHDFLARWDLSEEEVAAVLRRMVRVKRYVDSRVSHAAQVSEAEVTAWLAEHASEPRDRQVARTRLVAERVGVEVKALVREIRARAEVRFVSRFAGGK